MIHSIKIKAASPNLDKPKAMFGWNGTTPLKYAIKFKLGQNNLISQYDYQQFKKDFTKSAKLANPNEVAYVILLSPTHAKCVLKEPHNCDLPYIGNLAFNFKNGKLTAFQLIKVLLAKW